MNLNSNQVSTLSDSLLPDIHRVFRTNQAIQSIRSQQKQEPAGEIDAICPESGVRASALTPLTYFEICVFCKAQNRGARPWLAPVTPQVDYLSPAGGKTK